MTALAAAGLGVLIGAVVGALGGGGSVLAVPALVFGLGLSPHDATAASLVVVGVTAAVAAAAAARHGTVRWRSALLLTAAGLPASLAGTHLSARVPARTLLFAFAALLLVAAALLLRRAAPEPAAPAAPRVAGRWVRVLAAGTTIGALTGFFGVGGGFVLVPLLVLVLAFPMPAAVGTSLLVIALTSAVSLAARAPTAHVPVAVVAPFAAAATVAALGGQRLSRRLPTEVLTRAFAVLLLVVAGYVAVQAGYGNGMR